VYIPYIFNERKKKWSVESARESAIESIIEMMCDLLIAARATVVTAMD
jgi:hypothetical protein